MFVEYVQPLGDRDVLVKSYPEGRGGVNILREILLPPRGKNIT